MGEKKKLTYKNQKVDLETVVSFRTSFSRGHVSKWLQMNKQWSLDMSCRAGFDLKHRSAPAGLQSSGTHITLSLRSEAEGCPPLPGALFLFAMPVHSSLLRFLSFFLSFCTPLYSAQVTPPNEKPPCSGMDRSKYR